MKEIRILVIDDEIDVCAMLVQVFEAFGYATQYATNGKDALELVKSFNPHFIFLDVIMPEMSGLDVLKEIRKINTSIKVFMISGMHDLGMAKEAMKLGAIDYIPKPIDIDELVKYLNQETKSIDTVDGSEKTLLQDGPEWS